MRLILLSSQNLKIIYLGMFFLIYFSTFSFLFNVKHSHLNSDFICNFALYVGFIHTSIAMLSFRDKVVWLHTTTSDQCCLHSEECNDCKCSSFFSDIEDASESQWLHQTSRNHFGFKK